MNKQPTIKWNRDTYSGSSERKCVEAKYEKPHWLKDTEAECKILPGSMKISKEFVMPDYTGL